ncbi:MAG: aminotransferase class V-fold PLP-dependent enzyme [Pseudomonadota bacterium]
MASVTSATEPPLIKITMTESLIAKSEFLALESVAHLATGGESPMLNSHQRVLQQFLHDKSQGEPARALQHAVFNEAREQCAQLFKVPAHDLTFLSSATEGINTLCYALDWREGDNVVVADVEFPSDVLPWANLRGRGVEVRVVRHQQWQINEQDILSQIDDRTRVVAVSQVSMFTGQHMNVQQLSQGVRDAGAIFLMDATHAAGVVPVDASVADVVVCSCYKWLLGTHGTAVFYVNSNTMAQLAPPFVGWASVASGGGWQSPLEWTMHDNADRFLAANPSYISLYLLNNSLRYLLAIGENRIQQHSLALGKLIFEVLEPYGVQMMTPLQDSRRAGNVCFMTANVDKFRSALEQHGVLVWGAYGDFGRVRLSAHVHNDTQDIQRLADAIKKCQYLLGTKQP